MIPAPDVVAFVIDTLNETGVTYLITGSIASNAYSQPRATVDADFMVSATPDAFRRLFDRLQTRLVKEPQMAFESVTGKTQHRFLEVPHRGVRSEHGRSS